MKILSCLTLLFLLSACQASLLTEKLAPSGSVLYFDDFSDPASGWPKISEESGRMEYVDGQYQVSIEQASFDLRAVSGQSFGDVQVEVDATPLMDSPMNRFGLLCRYQGPQDFYFFIVTGDGYYGIGKVKDGERSLIGQEMLSYSAAILQPNIQNRLRFDCRGQTLTAYANGRSISAVSDKDFSSGDAGIIAGSFEQGGVDVVFDNFVVYKP